MSMNAIIGVLVLRLCGGQYVINKCINKMGQAKTKDGTSNTK